MGINENLKRDKAAVDNAIINYIADSSQNKDAILSNTTRQSVKRDDINSFVAKGDIQAALISLEELRDLKTGITRKLMPVIDSSTPVLIRDARNCLIPAKRETEAFEMQYLNAIRAAKDIAVTSPNKANIEQALNDLAINTIKEAPALGEKLSYDQKSLAKEYKKKIQNIAKMMERDYGVSDAYKKLNTAKDFQNFKDDHANIVTISTLKNNDKKYVIIEAEVGLKGLTTKQRGQYQIIDGLKNLTAEQKRQYIAANINKIPKWYIKMNSSEQELFENNASKMLDDKHVISSQNRTITASMLNAAEKRTMIFDENSKIEVLHTSKHAGTIASLIKDKTQRQIITDENAQQLKEWVGNDATPHLNTLNSGPIGAGADPAIVKMSSKAIKQVGGKGTNTAFNKFRLFGNLANDLTGVKASLTEIANDNIELKNYIKPRSRFERLFGINKPQNDPEAIITKMPIEQQQFYRDAINLRKMVEKADVPLRIGGDKENLNIVIATDFNLLNNDRNKLIDKGIVNGQKEEIIIACASGKDRTGLEMQNETNKVLAKKFNMDINEIDKQLLANGHTANQAGSIYAGGGTLGCFGTKSENKAGIPVSRKNLSAIIEASASNNKIKGKSQLKESETRSVPQVQKLSQDIAQNQSTKVKWQGADISTFPSDKETGNIEVIGTHRRPMPTPKTKIIKDSMHRG